MAIIKEPIIILVEKIVKDLDHWMFVNNFDTPIVVLPAINKMVLTNEIVHGYRFWNRDKDLYAFITIPYDQSQSRGHPFSAVIYAATKEQMVVETNDQKSLSYFPQNSLRDVIALPDIKKMVDLLAMFLTGTIP